MARRDVIHDAVKNALIKDGWQITADPYRIIYKDATLEADMRTDKLIVATRENRSIAGAYQTLCFKIACCRH